jgi:hypothetical protein
MIINIFRMTKKIYFKFGADRGRTGGLMNAIHALYQLSYSPKILKTRQLLITYYNNYQIVALIIKIAIERR